MEDKEEHTIKEPKEKHHSRNSNTFFQVLRNVYMESPLNFSTLTGVRYPGIPCYWEWGLTTPLLGSVAENLQPDGLLSILRKVGKLALQHPSGMCYWWLGNVCCILITNPDDIRNYYFTQKEYVSRELPVVSDICGSAVVLDSGQQWRQKRLIYKDKVYVKSPLNSLAASTQTIIDAELRELRKKLDQDLDINDFVYDAILKIVLQSFMEKPAPTKQVIESVKKFVLKATTEGFDFGSIFKWMLPNEILRFLFRYKNIFKKILPETLNNIFFTGDCDFDKFKSDLKSEFAKLFFSGNAHEGSLLQALREASHNFENEKEDKSNYGFGDGLILLLAAVETMSSTILFAIKKLAENPNVVATLRSDLRDESDVRNSEYLNWIIKETLRDPPTPVIMPRPNKEKFYIGQGEWQIPVFRGDVIMVSPWILGHSKKIWGDPENFRPERFETLSNDQKAALIPFGVGEHQCIGERFAMQTIKLFLTSLLNEFDLRLDPELEVDDEVTLKQGSLKPANLSTILIKPKESPKYSHILR